MFTTKGSFPSSHGSFLHGLTDDVIGACFHDVMHSTGTSGSGFMNSLGLLSLFALGGPVL